MSYNFYLPCEPDSVVMVSIDDVGDLHFHDDKVTEEIDTALALIELGFEPDEVLSVCVSAYLSWKDDFVGFVCKSNAIPIMDAGFVACAWAEEAFKRSLPMLLEIDSDITQPAEAALERAKRFFLGSPVHYRRVLDNRRELQEVINKNTRYAYFDGVKVKLHSAVLGVSAIQSCLNTIVSISHQEGAFGFVREPIESICEPASILDDVMTLQELGKVRRDEIVVGIAVEALSVVQQAKGAER